MIHLTGYEFKKLPIHGLRPIRHLDEANGPLLTEFCHPRGDRYLYYWCDCTDATHRWMVVRVSETTILRLVQRIIPLDLVIPTASLDDFVFFVETNRQGETTGATMVELPNIPKKYKPSAGAYLDEQAGESQKSLSLLIEESLSLENFSGLPRIFSHAYSFLYAMLILKPVEFERIPWKDGFGGMNFYQWLMRLIPGEGRPTVGAMQYASPGFIRFALDRGIANEVCKCIELLNRDPYSINHTYAVLYGYIRDSGLNKKREPGSPPIDLAPHKDFLLLKTSELLAALGIEDKDALLLAATPLESAKIALSFTRRVRELGKFERDGLVRFPSVLSSPEIEIVEEDDEDGDEGYDATFTVE